MIGGLASHPVITRFGPRPVMVVSSVIITANFLFLAFSHSGIWQFVVWDFIWGFVFGFIYTAANAAFLHDATPAEAAMYSSANTVIASAVGGIGPAIFTAVLTSRFIPHTPIPDPVGLQGHVDLRRHRHSGHDRDRAARAPPAFVKQETPAPRAWPGQEPGPRDRPTALCPAGTPVPAGQGSGGSR